MLINRHSWDLKSAHLYPGVDCIVRLVGRVMDISPCGVGGLESDTYFQPHWRGSSYQNTTGKEKRKTS